MMGPKYSEADDLIRMALAEDIGPGDRTTAALVDAGRHGRARVIAKQPCVLAGLSVFARVFSMIDERVSIDAGFHDGDTVSAGDTVIELRGPLCALLTGERTALNFIQRLSGVATLTRAFVTRLAEYPTILLDTRKTTPGWRALEKQAVRAGGGTNHRFGLYDAALIKENHIAAAGGINVAIARVRALGGPHLSVEVEVTCMEELREALAAAPDIVMLDNMSLDEMRVAVAEVAGRVRLEASGNVTLDTVAEIAATGVDYISVGGITHSAPSVDFSILIDPVID